MIFQMGPAENLLDVIQVGFRHVRGRSHETPSQVCASEASVVPWCIRHTRMGRRESE